MKRDYYSDIKLAQRIIFENTAYLLTMLDKKVDSFSSQKTANMRARERNDLLHPDNVLHPEAPRAILNPLATLANDLTKPVWNCITRVEPVAVSVLPEFGLQTLTHRLISAFNQSMFRFFERFKYEHQDQVSLKLHINVVDRLSKIKLLFEDLEQKKINQIQLLLQKLFGMLQSVYRKKFQASKSEEFLAYLQIFQKIIIKEPVSGQYLNPYIVAEITIFTQQIEQYIKNVAESLSGPVYINYTLQQQKLSLVLHPMMMAIYCSVKNQIIHQEQGKQQTNSKNSFFQSRIDSQQPLFQQLKSYNCSKITFINMDGYESSANLHLAKYLRKYLQYISFPLQEQSFMSNNIEFNDLTFYFRSRSQMLAKQYMACFYQSQKHGNLYGSRDSNQRQTFEQLYKRLLVIPVNSIYISNKTDSPSISGYQSQFVFFMMKEIIYNQIRQFGPSVIIVSHSSILPMLSSHLQQIFAQLSILTNMKIIFYNNITHSIVPYVTEQKKDYFLMNHIKYFRLKQQWSSSLSFTNQSQRFPISTDMLQRASIFFKICSGTANLTFEARQNDQKYQNSKILRYAGILMRKICQKHPTLSKLDHRFLQYLKIDKLYSNHFQSNKKISPYHRKVFDLAQRELAKRYGQQFLSSTQIKSFFQEYCTRLAKQKQSQETKYITKLTNQNQSYGLIALEFQICQNENCELVNLSQNSQILISTTKKYINCPIFLLNHINREKNLLQNYFGYIDETIERSCDSRVKLQKFIFQQNIYNIDSSYQHLTQFNFYQTQSSVILFWPILYDAKQAILHNFQRITYHPTITSLFFVGSKTDLRHLTHVQPVNQSYKSIHPRIGCTCYQPPFSNSIYVFGGFYTDIENYLDFQTDISVIKLEKEFGISIQNVPKSFFMNFQQHSSFRMVTSVNNDFVRPRVQYEVYEIQSQANDKQILLIGGVGEKFTRPFSLIGYMAHLIRFQGPYLAKIDRIKINNIVPANLNRPLKSRATTQMPVIKVAQNRRIFASKATIHPGVLTFSSFKLKYISQNPNQNKKIFGKQMAMRNRRMTYTKNYELAMQQKFFELQYPRQTTFNVSLRESNQNKSYRCILRHYSYKSNNQANVLLSVQANRIYLFNLVFYLQDDAAQRFINLQGKTVRLAPHNIVAADTYSKDVFVLIYHQEFTEDLYILARSNVKSTSQLIQNDIRQIFVNEIYCFDSIPQKCVIKIIEGEQVALLHGLNFTENSHQEYLVKRIGSYYTRLPIQASEKFTQIRQAFDISKKIFQSNKKSFILGSGHKLFCISFITVERVQGTRQGIYVVVEQLNLSENVFKWRIKSHNKFIFELNVEQIIDFQNRRLNKPPNEQIIFQTKSYMLNKQILDVYQTTEGKDIFIVLTDQRYIYEGSINIENFGRFNNLLFLPIKPEGQFIMYQNYETERTRDRSNGFHIYAKSIDKAAMGIKTQTELISEEMGTINIV